MVYAGVQKIFIGSKYSVNPGSQRRKVYRAVIHVADFCSSPLPLSLPARPRYGQGSLPHRGKYKMMILFWLADKGVMRHNQIKRAMGAISFITLSLCSRNWNGTRKEYPRMPQRMENVVIKSVRMGRPKKAGRPKKGSPKDLARRERERTEHERVYFECLEKYQRYQCIVHEDSLEERLDEAIEILSYLVEKDYPHCDGNERTKSIRNFSGEFFADEYKKDTLSTENVSRAISDMLQELKALKMTLDVAHKHIKLKL